MNKIFNLSSERIFIAGAYGMVGKALFRTIEKINPKPIILAPSRSDLDCSKADDVYDWFKRNKPTVVIIAAAKVGGILFNSKNPADFILDNLKIQNNLIEASWRFGIKRLLFLGSSCIYPKLCNQPIKEEYLLTGSLENTNEYYAIAKIAGIKLCEGLRRQYGFDAICLMPTNLYGKGDNYDPLQSHVLPAMVKRIFEAKINNFKEVKCWGTGKPRREFLYVDDLADACIFCLERFMPSKDFYANDESIYLNIGTGKDLSIRELAEIISLEIGFKGRIIWDSSKPDGTPQKLLDISRIKALGWQAKTSLKDGIKKSILDFERRYI